MRSLRAVLAALAVCAAMFDAPARAHAVQPGFSDVICPEATQYVLAVGKLRTDDAPQRIYDAAQAAADVYALCSKDKLAYGFREAQHYADTRGSGFGVVAAQALISLNRLDEARRELLHCRELAQQVVDWQTETEAYQTANVHLEPRTIPSDHRPSMYRAAAKAVVAAADIALAEVERRAGIPRRQAGPAVTEPSPSP